MSDAGPVGLVLSGGGVRGAYEVGVLEGVAEVLGWSPDERPPVSIFCGTSVGAINAAFLAAHAHRGDLGVGGLVRLWSGLRIEEHLDLNRALIIHGLTRAWVGRHFADSAGLPSLLNARSLEKLVRQAVPWPQLHDNVAAGLVQAVMVAALDIGSGRTAVFTELAPGAEFRPTRDPQRHARLEPLTADHVLASAAIPLLFPARRLGDRYFCDGGLRFNTPIAPAIRAGAASLMIVSARYRPPPSTPLPPAEARGYPTFTTLLGKLLGALLLDPVPHDLHMLERFNRLVEALEATLDESERARIDRALIDTRGAPYRRLRTLFFAPSEDVGRLAAAHIRAHLPTMRIGWWSRWFLRRAARRARAGEGDLASFLLFDGAFADKLIALGRRDAQARADDVRAFFGRSGARAT